MLVEVACPSGLQGACHCKSRYGSSRRGHHREVPLRGHGSSEDANSTFRPLCSVIARSFRACTSKLARVLHTIETRGLTRRLLCGRSVPAKRAGYQGLNLDVEAALVHRLLAAVAIRINLAEDAGGPKAPRGR
jgi:hypothetical protein